MEAKNEPTQAEIDECALAMIGTLEAIAEALVPLCNTRRVLVAKCGYQHSLDQLEHFNSIMQMVGPWIEDSDALGDEDDPRWEKFAAGFKAYDTFTHND